MKHKSALIIIISLVATVFSCSGRNKSSGPGPVANVVTVSTPAPTPTAVADPNLKSKVENELRRNGFDKIVFDTTTSPPTIRGTYPKGRLAELIQTARLASGGEVQNGAIEQGK